MAYKIMKISFLKPLNLKPCYETSYDIPPGRNSERIERRTSNAQHHTFNIDNAALSLFYYKRAVEY